MLPAFEGNKIEFESSLERFNNNLTNGNNIEN